MTVIDSWKYTDYVQFVFEGHDYFYVGETDTLKAYVGWDDSRACHS